MPGRAAADRRDALWFFVRLHWRGSHEIRPEAQLLPPDIKARSHCRAICGEMHSGFASLRSSLPMNLKAHFPGFKVWSRAQGDIDRVLEIWKDCLVTYGGPYLFGKKPCLADAMYAPVVTRFLTYDVAIDKVRRLLQAHHGIASHAGVGGRGQGRARGRPRRAGRRVLAPTSTGNHGVHGCLNFATEFTAICASWTCARGIFDA